MKCNIQSAPVKEWEWTVEEIVEAQKEGLLRVNPEYQRGAVWAVPQMRMLIDSMLRGYCIPLIYLHHVVRKTARTMSEHYDIIDGQQRINAICSFIEGVVVQGTISGDSSKFKLLPDTQGRPKAFGSLYDSGGADRKRFPAFLHGQPCWWGGKKFKTDAKDASIAFTREEQRQFLDSKIAVAVVDCEKHEEHEVRDMFIRLQGGSDLKPQEKRDAWPGGFCELVLDIGGKFSEGKTGHPFFRDVIGLPRNDRGETREIAAEMLMLFLNRKGLRNVSLGAEALNDCYREYVGLDSASPEMERFFEILVHLADAFCDDKNPLGKNKKPYAIHLMLFVDFLRDAAPDKIDEIADAFRQFRSAVVKAEDEEEPPTDDNLRQMWEFSGAIRGRGSTTDLLISRHKIFVRQMSRLLGVSAPYSLDSPENTERKGSSVNAKPRPLAQVQSSFQVWEIDHLIDERKGGLLFPNTEYQRGSVWKEYQRRLLIDSVMRNYQIPLIYLHKVQSGKQHAKLKGGGQLRFEIIDGQQRIDSFCLFRDGNIPEKKTKPLPPLFDPSKPPDSDWFPNFIQEQECGWGGKTFDGLENLQKEFRGKKMAVVEVSCDDPDSAKDMFIRLQGGTPLKPQEVRDAWPGKFCELVLTIGGKPGASYGPGHDFFREKVKTVGAGGVTRRQLVAQLLMLYLSRKDSAIDFVVVDGEKLDGYYRSQVGRDLDSDEVRRFKDILGKLLNLFTGANIPPMKGIEVIHLVLFVDALMGNYVPIWEDAIVAAHRRFTKAANEADVARRNGETDGIKSEFLDYSENAARNTTKAPSIRRRHEIYVRAMMEFMGDSIKRKDPKRTYNSAEREFIFYRDEGKCHKCGGDVLWKDADIHHKEQHSEGGPTTLRNGVLIHRECHRDLHAEKSKGGE